VFEALWDEVSKLGSFRWPVARGEVTDALIERRRDSRGNEHPRLAVAYKFSVGDDGPYDGEGFWQLRWSWNALAKIKQARRKVRSGHSVRVRYRPDDPSVNKLDGAVGGLLKE
jgi:hypothetical protein